MQSSLPIPAPEALAHSERLRARIAQRIAGADGWIAFSTYMDLALHAPGLGYYAAGSAKLGAAGDFVTAPEMSPLYGQALAAQFAPVLRETHGDVLELGAGTGRLAAQVLGRLATLEALPQRYLILEPSADLRERQRAYLARHAPEQVARVAWLDALPARLTGAIFGNEVLDALPVDLLIERGDEFLLRGVGLATLAADMAAPVATPAFRWVDRPLEPGPVLSAARARFPHATEDDYISEINLAAEALVRTLGALLERGLIMFVDYGFPAGEYYHPQRDRGTLMCHYRQRAHDDPFFLPGLQDITAHVDFSAIAHAGVEAGLTLAGYIAQAGLLMNCGILDLLAAVSPEDPATYLPQSNAVQKLLSPAEMGELFKAIALTKNFDEPLAGFSPGDRCYSL